jgi:selenocysteine lyase/cysteine desulfurase
VDASLTARGTTREAVHRAHWTRFREAADAAPGVNWLSPRDWELSSSLFLIGVDGRPANDLSDTLGRDHGAIFRPFRSQGLDGVRISPNVQTTDAEIDTMIRLLGT